jgi:hypothetical protein
MQGQRIFYTSNNETSSKKILYDAHHDDPCRKFFVLYNSYKVKIKVLLIIKKNCIVRRF